VLDGEGVVRARLLKHLFEMAGGFSDGRLPPLRSAAATREPPLFLLFFFFFWRFEAPSPASSSRFTLPLAWSKIAPTASSLEAWLVAMSRSSLVVRGLFRPSLWTRDSQVVPENNASITSVSATAGNALHSLEKRRMYSRRVSPSFCRQFLRSHGFPGRS
jgi:hypothetical protein